MFLFKIIRAAITPGTHPQQVSIKTIVIDPHPLSKTARGGKIIARKTWRHPIDYPSCSPIGELLNTK